MANAIKKDELEEWKKLEDEASELAQKAKTLRDRQKQLEEKFETTLRDSGKQSIKRHGFLLSWQPGRASVQWAAEYLKECGAEKANALKKAAAEDVKEQGKLVISPPVAA